MAEIIKNYRISEHTIYIRPVCKYCLSEDSNQTNMKSTIKTVAKVTEKFKLINR